MKVNIPIIPSQEMLDAGIQEFKNELPSVWDDMLEYFETEEEANDKVVDVVCFVYQAMVMKGDME